MKSWLLLIFLFGDARSFLPTRLNYSDPQLSDIFCPEMMTGYGWDLKAITREGIRQEVRNLFNEDPPPGSTGFYVPEDATLSEMFAMYYGKEASATRFYKSVNSISWANADVDSMESTRYDTPYHFDGSMLVEGQEKLSLRHNLIVSSIMKYQSYEFARQQIGYSLHAIQDFYSHSSWIELGNTDILKDLGLPTFGFDNVAGTNDATCTSCPSFEGSCVGNVITGGNLTSGYYEYDVPEASSYIVAKPTGKGKCSFGGTLDTSADDAPIGGINKASTSPCFSAHNYLHEDAAALAIEATQNYMGIIRTTVGNTEFRYLLDLYQGSALTIVIDTTASMGLTIAAVKTEIHLIVENTPADLYILVPYNDPDYGPATVTTDPNVFLDAVDALEASGGGDLPELVWSGMQLALTNTPSYSVLYLFTDAGGKDGELMNADFAMAQDKNIIVTVIYGGTVSTSHEKTIITDYTDYMRLAEVTGGEFILISDFRVEDVVSILENGIEESKVSLALRRDVTGDVTFDILVDETISSLEITISGLVNSAILTDTKGTAVDLMDKTNLESMANVTVNAYTSTVKDIEFAFPSVGNWIIEVSGSSEYSVLADGSSILGYMISFTELDIRPPRPNYKLISGNPITGLQYYVENILVGWIDSSVASVFDMQFIDKQGVVLSSVPYDDQVDDEFYIKSEPLPANMFYVALHGYLSSGNMFVRMYQTMVIPVNVSVNVDLSKSILTATPGSTVIAVFDVHNYGPESTYNYYATDDKGFVNSWTPTSSQILADGNETITVTFVVPTSAKAWEESTVIVTASSELIDTNVNSDIVYFLVLPETRDSVPPTCSSSDIPDCSGYNSESTCQSGTWMATATFLDEDSGMSVISTQPSNNMTDLSVPSFTPGTTSEVTVTLTASCCVTTLQIIGVDEQGNIGTCAYDMGKLDGVITFEAIEVGSFWVYLRWTVYSVRSDLAKYTVTTAGLSEDVVCWNTSCYHNFTSLEPCTVHSFTLTPYFDSYSNGTIYPGSDTTTAAETLDQDPYAPINGRASKSDGIGGVQVVVMWDPPVDDDCIILYQLCYGVNFAATSDCLTTTETTYTLTGLEHSLLYIINITSQTKSGLTSSPLTIYVDTAEGDILTFEAIDEGSTWIYLRWTVTTVRSDLFKYTLTRDSVFSNDVFCFDLECYYNSTSLSPCSTHFYNLTPYFDEYGNLTFTAGSTATTEDTTLDAVPGSPTNVQIFSVGSNSSNSSAVDITWDPPTDTSCVSYYEVCYSSGNSNQTCDNTVLTFYRITGLELCTQYNISVTTVSNTGIHSQPVIVVASSGDGAPGAPQNLQVDDITTSVAEISWDPPLENSKCVDRYDVTWNEVLKPLSEAASQDGGTSRKGIYDAIISPLLACTNYSFRVYGVSAADTFGPYAETFGETDETTPTAPSFLNVAPDGTTSLSVTWSAGDRACVAFYRLCVEDPISATDECTEVNGNSYLVEGLIACTTYVIELTAVSPGGLESATIFASGSTDDEKPGPPVNLTVTNVTSHSVSIQFDTPTENPQCVSEYDIDYIDLDETTVKSTTSDRSTNTNVLSGLEACTDILVMVRAQSPRGLMGDWANTTATTLEDIPSIPQNLQIDEATSTSISVKWFTPATNDRCVDRYQIIWLDEFGQSGFDHVDAVENIFEYRYTISSLLSCVNYEIVVTGVTISGAEGLSAITIGSTAGCVTLSGTTP